MKNMNICEFCSYQTDDDRNWRRHLRTKKHKNNCSEKNEFSVKEKKYINKIKNLEQKLHEKELESKDKELECKNQQIKMLQEQVTTCNNRLSSADNIINNSVSTLGYVMKKYAGAPALEPLHDYRIITTNNDELMIDVIYHTKKKMLHKYLGDIIIRIYKKENPSEQSSWSVDTSRLNYVVKEITWIKDNKGIKMSNKIIKPLLNYIKELSKEYINRDDPENITLADKMICGEILIAIKNDVLLNEINKYIAPHFKLNCV